LHLRHEARLDPVGPLRERARWGRVERHGVDREGLEQLRSLRPNASFQPFPVPTFPANRSARPS
jgi:hypothetical protein